MHACIRIYIHTYVYIHIYIHTYVYIHTYIHTYAHEAKFQQDVKYKAIALKKVKKDIFKDVTMGGACDPSLVK